jgi:hypothetical protein
MCEQSSAFRYADAIDRPLLLSLPFPNMVLLISSLDAISTYLKN